MICDPFDVVAVPFPFTDRPAAKRRPALILSRRPFNEAGHSVLAMITSKSHAPWPGDVVIRDSSQTGLSSPSRVRLKLFTLDNRLILRSIGKLSPEDANGVRKALNTYLGLQ